MSRYLRTTGFPLLGVSAVLQIRVRGFYYSRRFILYFIAVYFAKLPINQIGNMKQSTG